MTIQVLTGHVAASHEHHLCVILIGLTLNLWIILKLWMLVRCIFGVRLTWRAYWPSKDWSLHALHYMCGKTKRLRWLGDVEWMVSRGQWVAACKSVEENWVRGRSRSQKPWDECVKKNLVLLSKVVNRLCNVPFLWQSLKWGSRPTWTTDAANDGNDRW